MPVLTYSMMCYITFMCEMIFEGQKIGEEVMIMYRIYKIERGI
jgi:hypothetical protein